MVRNPREYYRFWGVPAKTMKFPREYCRFWRGASVVAGVDEVYNMLPTLAPGGGSQKAYEFLMFLHTDFTLPPPDLPLL